MSAAFEAAAVANFGAVAMARGSSAEIVTRFDRAFEITTHNPLVFDFEALWYYDPPTGAWAELTEDAIIRMVQAIDGWGIEGDDGKTRQLSVGGHTWRDAISGLRARPRVRGGFFDAAPLGMAFTDGFLRVVDGRAELLPHGPEHRQRHSYPMAWQPDAKCPRWLQALDEWGLSLEQQAFLAQWVGTALTGSLTESAKILMLVGGGANGKSVCVDVITGLFPPTWVQSVSLHEMGQRFSTAMLRDCRLNAVSETDNKDFLQSNVFKAIVSGDPVKGERKGKDPFTFRSRAAHLFSINPPMPSVADTSAGFWRRIEAIEFLRTFPEGEKVEGLAKIILADELPGIIAWAIEGACDRQRHGWAEIDRSFVAEWRHGNDTIALWLEEREDEDAREWTAASTLFADFKMWAARTGKGAGMGMPAWGERLKIHLGAERFDRTRRGSNYYVSLRSALGGLSIMR